MTTRGVFRLSSYRSQELLGEGVPIDDVWYKDKLQQDGYVVGGSDSSDNSVSYYQSLSYDTDTRSNVANLPQAKSGVYAVASPSNGYVIGGGPGNPSQPNNTYYSNTTKLSFSTQTSSALPGVDMSESFGRGGSAGSTTAGYVCGGYSGPGGEGTGWSRLEKLTYSSETIARIPGSNLPGKGYGGATGWDHAATGNGDDFAVWIAGNRYPSPSSSLTGTCVFKLNYSNDSWSHSTSWNLSGPGNRMQKAGMTSSDTGAYIVGGSYPANTRVQKISFASMTNSSVTNSALPGRTDLTATGNTSSGYFAGGATGNNANGTGGSVSSIVEKMNFSTNSISRVPALDLANGLSNVGSMSAAGDNKVPPAPKRWIDNAVPGGNAVNFDGSGDSLSIADSEDFNYGSGDFTLECWVYPNSASQNEKLIHSHTSGSAYGPCNLFMNNGVLELYSSSNNTGFNVVSAGSNGIFGTLAVGQWSHVAVSRQGNNIRIFLNGILKGTTSYSGSLMNATSTFDIAERNGGSYFDGKISNFRVVKGTAVYTGNFTVPTKTLTEIGGTVLLCCNQGSPTAATKTPGAITANGDPTSSFNADLKFNLEPTATPTPSSPAQPFPNLSNDGYNVGGRWNSHPSYGSVSQSWIMKTSYASETTSLSPNKMIVGRNQFGTFSSASAGYVLGGSYEGWPSQQPATTNIQKITYSNDTASTVPGQLVGNSAMGSGVSNVVTGYYGGGIPSNLGSNIQKYTFSTDTISGQIPDKLGNNTGSPAGLYNMGSAGNATHGFFLGGDVSGNPSYLRRGTKIEYATDTANASQMFGDLQGARNFAAVGYGNIAAYLSGREGGGSGSGNRSLLAKLTYSTDSITTIPSTTFNNTNGSYAGHGSETKGFFAGGGEETRQYRLTYSTESLSLSPSNSWNFPSSVPGSGGPGAYQSTQGGAFSARNNDGGKIPTPVVL